MSCFLLGHPDSSLVSRRGGNIVLAAAHHSYCLAKFSTEGISRRTWSSHSVRGALGLLIASVRHARLGNEGELRQFCDIEAQTNIRAAPWSWIELLSKQGRIKCHNWDTNSNTPKSIKVDCASDIFPDKERSSDSRYASLYDMSLRWRSTSDLCFQPVGFLQVLFKAAL